MRVHTCGPFFYFWGVLSSSSNSLMQDSIIVGPFISIQSLSTHRISVGILFVLLAALISTVAYFRRRHLNRDFSDQNKPASDTSPSHKRIWGAPFATAGWIVIYITLLVTGAQIVLIVLLMQV